MPRPAGSHLNTTIQVRESIVESCRRRPMTYSELEEEVGLGYKAVWKHIQTLKKEGRIVFSGRRDGKDTFVATKQKIIPHIPGPTESISPMRIVLRVAQTEGKYKSKLEQMDERWSQVICGIMRTAVVVAQEDTFPAERHAEYEKFLRIYREELNLRISQVNAIIQTEKFWTEAGLKEFQNDPGYDAEAILTAFVKANAAE